MNVTIEHPFCPYCSEVTNLYFRIINTLLFSKDENELRTSMESLKKETRLDRVFHVRLWGTPSLDMQTKTERQKQNLSTPHHDDPILTWSLCTIRTGVEYSVPARNFIYRNNLLYPKLH